VADPEAGVQVERSRRPSAVWLLPILAALVGAWLVWYAARNEGPTITIRFPTAEGIVAGETRLKARSVEVGIVESVTLDAERDGVVVHARMDPETRDLLREDTRFWVVRPRVGFGGVSGLGTLLSGGYLELAPGTGAPGARSFVGLDDPPVTGPGTPGVRVVLVSREAGSVHAGNPVLYHGYEIGRIESERFDPDRRVMRYEAFVEAPYDRLVGDRTRFWNASGVTLRASASGFELSAGSLETLARGGVALGHPEDDAPGAAVADGTEFTLHPDARSAEEDPYRRAVPYLVRFEQSVRGLEPGAAVELRGITVGRVRGVLLDAVDGSAFGDAAQPIPVVLELEPARLRLPDDDSGETALRQVLTEAIGNGLFASLQTGNLITGQLYVALDFDPEGPVGRPGRAHGFETLPVRSTGLAQLEKKLGQVLDQLAALPLEGLATDASATLARSAETLAALERTLARIESTLASDSVQALPAELVDTLAALRGTLETLGPGSPVTRRLEGTLTRLDRSLEGVEALSRALEEQPSTLLRPVRRAPDPIPGGDR
jgi:paraquat-inducible protein B